METFIRAREDEACVSIPIRDNQVQSSVRRKSFDVVLRGANPLIRVGGQTSATVTITDDDGEFITEWNLRVSRVSHDLSHDLVSTPFSGDSGRG